MPVRLPVVFVTGEHFLPFFVGLGAAGGDPAQRYRQHFSYAGLAMDAYVRGDRADR